MGTKPLPPHGHQGSSGFRVGRKCGNKDKLTFLLCDLEENGRRLSQRRQAMSSVKGKRISI